MRLKGNKSMFKKNSPVFDIVKQADIKNSAVADGGDEYIVIPTDGLTDMSTVNEWINAGGVLEQLPIYLKMEGKYLTDPVAEGLPDRIDTVTSEVRTWENWSGENYSGPIDASDGDKIISCQGFGKFLTSEEMTLVNSIAHTTVILEAEVRSLMV